MAEHTPATPGQPAEHPDSGITGGQTGDAVASEVHAQLEHRLAGYDAAARKAEADARKAEAEVRQAKEMRKARGSTNATIGGAVFFSLLFGVPSSLSALGSGGLAAFAIVWIGLAAINTAVVLGLTRRI